MLLDSVDAKWRLTEGYSNFVEGSVVELRLRQRRLAEKLELSPIGLLRRSRPLRVTFSAVRRFNGRLPSGMRWTVRPEATVKARVLFSGNPLQGNFRVPKGHFAVQWELEGKVQNGMETGTPAGLISVEAGTRLQQVWANILPDQLSAVEGLRLAWKSFQNPFDPAAVLRMSPIQMIRWEWKGRLRVQIEAQLGIEAGFSIPGRIAFADVVKSLAATAGLTARAMLEDEGRFSLQARRRGDEYELSVRKIQRRLARGGFTAGAALGSSIRIRRFGPPQPGAFDVLRDGIQQPLRLQVNRALKKSVARKLKVGLSAEISRTRSRSAVLKAKWRNPDSGLLRREWARILRGKFPEPRKGLLISGVLQNIKSRQVEVRFNLLDWLRIGRTRTDSQSESISVTPDGQMIFEKGRSIEKIGSRFEEIQFLSLLLREQVDEDESQSSFIWKYARHSNFSRAALREQLELARHSGLISEFETPENPSLFPAQLRLLFVSEFSAAAVASVRQAESADVWEALVRALEIGDRPRYGRREARFWRDWIDSRRLRELVDENPAQAHLESLYPVAGRTEAERRLAVAGYRKAKRFLRLLAWWREGNSEAILEGFELGMEVPIFVYFHLLSPSTVRRSAVLVRGSFERVWGDPRILEN